MPPLSLILRILGSHAGIEWGLKMFPHYFFRFEKCETSKKTSLIMHAIHNCLLDFLPILTCIFFTWVLKHNYNRFKNNRPIKKTRCNFVFHNAVHLFCSFSPRPSNRTPSWSFFCWPILTFSSLSRSPDRQTSELTHMTENVVSYVCEAIIIITRAVFFLRNTLAFSVHCP